MNLLFLIVRREECSNKGGTSSGSCASGFGVCCISKLEFAGFLLAEIGNLYAVEQFQLQLVVVDQHLTTAPTLRCPTPIFTLALVEQQFARPAQAFAKWVIVSAKSMIAAIKKFFSLSGQARFQHVCYIWTKHIDSFRRRANSRCLVSKSCWWNCCVSCYPMSYWHLYNHQPSQSASGLRNND